MSFASFVARIAFPANIAAAALCLAYAVVGALHIPEPKAIKLTIVCGCLTLFWIGCAVWIRHEQRKDEAEETLDA